jgi:lysophospholipase L1-like esterase
VRRSILSLCLLALALSAAPAAAASKPRLLVIGDSLAVGADAPLRALLPDWRIRSVVRVGRPLSEGMGVFRALEPAPVVTAFSLFTNDDPANVSSLVRAVRESLNLERGAACAIWATVVRPAVAGRSYSPVNRRLKRLARRPELLGRLVIVPWAAKVRRHPYWMGPDRVHPTPSGYQARAELYARAVRRCQRTFAPDH